ncbi:hypothetical protein SAMN04488065_2078 [Haloplanus vescus]|uniref:Uncharacterized protein n=1 Tax=Haloplanus vescus TaxID=555874 RepID=A0A1H3Z205_9EURY|nr:hypothetical protein [Haloplanus vescus]SEA17471.1 hypothetical protein SAMN04488065_2078 [Haloplanus vescus]
MATDVTAVGGQGADVMASVDDGPGASEFVIADVSRDDAWLSIQLRDASRLDDWR